MAFLQNFNRTVVSLVDGNVSKRFCENNKSLNYGCECYNDGKIKKARYCTIS